MNELAASAFSRVTLESLFCGLRMITPRLRPEGHRAEI